MSNFSDTLKHLRTEKHLSQLELASILGVGKSIISMYESGHRKPSFEVLESIADYFNVDMDYLVGKTQCRNKYQETANKTLFPTFPVEFSNLKRIPILGRIAAGSPMYAEEHIEGYTYTDLNGGHEYFGLRVRGDSMDAAGIKDGYTVIVRRQETVDNGQIAVVLINGEDATLKRFTQTGDIVTLMPQSTNPIHQPFVFDLKDTHVDILGLVVKVEFSPL